ncbi:hypothetical protein ERJ75_001244200 [Trypanosoma vivax]|uniref:Putative serine peptidase n=1 Tax=Trypanosoma vivax (strain Y486) TaxID=1055687 RepID=G0TWH0_TRYVY|nr:putative serine peptidase [Trypanosoma vivax]KAH8609057.1 hypothetical protein ERJ75_001244200 [Trypanosoma vivax]CCC48308.1 putative serine peptidase [Trypanosoma vivax Y486]
MLRRTLALGCSLQQLIHGVRHTSGYLRHAPPGLYLTSDFERSRRHATLLVDTSTGCNPPLTNGAYLLASTGTSDTTFREARSVLVGHPTAQDAADAVRLVDDVLCLALKRNGMEIPFEGIEVLVLSELHPLSSHCVRELLKRLPNLQIACSPLTASFLSDSTFFAGVQKSLLRNDCQFSAKDIVFADVPQTNIKVLEGDSSIPALGEGRLLQAVSGDLTPSRERWRRERKNKLAHFESFALFLYDPSFHAIVVPGTAGTHLPWLPFVVHEADAGVLLPLPDFFATQRHAGSSLMEVWRLQEQVDRVMSALERFPEAQRVLSTCYGEVPGGMDGYIGQLGHATQKLEELRSRLGHRLATDTERNMEKWSALLEEKIVKEILLVNTATTGTAPKVMDAYRKWATTSYCGRLARALAHASATLPPDPALKNTDRQPSKSSPSAGAETASGSWASVQELKRHFEKRGMAALSPILEREEIDVTVFLAMNSDDFRKLFKATFGVVKKMELLQNDLRHLRSG